mgnify:CR=1 FL=1
MKERGNIHICGVGGQGILLASELCAYGLLTAGFDVKKSEVHGMAQRGGSVEAHLRYSRDKGQSPLSEEGTADVIMGLETMESLRYLHFLKEGGTVVVSKQQIPPPAVTTGKTAYPDDCPNALRDLGITTIEIDGPAIARETGNIRTANVALTGALSCLLPVEEEVFLEVIETRFPAKIKDVNKKAFQAGRKAFGLREEQSSLSPGST